jgi:hypothetical protein
MRCFSHVRLKSKNHMIRVLQIRHSFSFFFRLFQINSDLPNDGTVPIEDWHQLRLSPDFGRPRNFSLQDVMLFWIESDAEKNQIKLDARNGFCRYDQFQLSSRQFAKTDCHDF